MEIKQVLILAGVIFLFSCRNESLVKMNVVINDSMEVHSYFVNGVENGPAISFNRKGNPWMMWNYKNGKMDGITLVYYPSGRLHNIQTYKSGLHHGYSYWFSENGNLQKKELYIKDVQVGHKYLYTIEGLPAEYLFTGYWNGYFFKQNVDIARKMTQCLGGKIADNFVVLADSSNDKTTILFAQPFGRKPKIEMIFIKPNGDWGNWPLSINNNDEYVIDKNLLRVLGRGDRVTGVSKYFCNGKVLVDEFEITLQNCFEVNSYLPDSNIKEASMK